MKLDLDETEVRTLIELLRYSLDSCPVESIGSGVRISAIGIEGIIGKLEQALEKS